MGAILHISRHSLRILYYSLRLTFEGLVLHPDGRRVDVSELSRRADVGVVLSHFDLLLFSLVVLFDVASFLARRTVGGVRFSDADTCLSFVWIINQVKCRAQSIPENIGFRIDSL